MCEVCGSNEAVSFSAFFNGLPVSRCEWKYACNCTSNSENKFGPGKENYYLTLNTYFHDPDRAIDDLKKKQWMTDQAWDEFRAMMKRFNEAAIV